MTDNIEIENAQKKLSSIEDNIAALDPASRIEIKRRIKEGSRSTLLYKDLTDYILELSGQIDGLRKGTRLMANLFNLSIALNLGYSIYYYIEQLEFSFSALALSTSLVLAMLILVRVFTVNLVLKHRIRLLEMERTKVKLGSLEGFYFKQLMEATEKQNDKEGEIDVIQAEYDLYDYLFKEYK